MTVDGASVRFKTSAGSCGVARTTFVAFVLTSKGQEVRVRYARKSSGRQWRCDECGSHRHATCPHQKAALEAWHAQRAAGSGGES